MPSKCYGVLGGESIGDHSIFGAHKCSKSCVTIFPMEEPGKQCLKQLFAQAKILTSELSLSIFILSFVLWFVFIVGSEWSATIKLTQVSPKSNLRVSNNTSISEAQQANCPEWPESLKTYSDWRKKQNIYSMHYFCLQLWLFIFKRCEHWKWFQICGEAPGAGGDAFGCASKFPVSHHLPQ